MPKLNRLYTIRRGFSTEILKNQCHLSVVLWANTAIGAALLRRLSQPEERNSPSRVQTALLWPRYARKATPRFRRIICPQNGAQTAIAVFCEIPLNQASFRNSIVIFTLRYARKTLPILSDHFRSVREISILQLSPKFLS